MFDLVCELITRGEGEKEEKEKEEEEKEEEEEEEEVEEEQERLSRVCRFGRRGGGGTWLAVVQDSSGDLSDENSSEERVVTGHRATP